MAVKLIARDLGLGALEIDPAYQRAVVPSQVKWIVGHYDEVAFGRLLVAEREGPDGGSYWVIDGQQRLTAARQLEMDRVPCLIFKSRGRPHEAHVFKEVNASRSLVKPLDVFRSALTAGDPESLAIAAAVESSGFKITNQPRKDPAYWRNIQAVTVLRDIYRAGGGELLRRTLETLTAAWEGDTSAADGLVLGGLARFLQKAEGSGYDHGRLVAQLKKHSPDAILRYVKDSVRLIVSQGSRSRSALFCQAILALYNKGLRSGKLTIPGISVLPEEAASEE